MTRRNERLETPRQPEPGDLADRAQEASLDPDEPGDVAGDQDIDTAETDADTSKARPLEDKATSGRDARNDD